MLAAGLLPAAVAQPAPYVLDPTFGNDGRGLATFAGATQAFSHGFHQYADGRLLIAGYASYPGGSARAALARFTPSGAPDPSFGPGGGGVVAYATSSRLYCYDVEIDTAGRILCAGVVDDSEAALARFTSDGLPDSTFGGDGVVEVTGGPPNYFVGIHRLPDGRLLVFGLNLPADSNFYVWRLLPDGTPDPAFNGGTPRHVATDFCFVDLDGISASTAAGGLAVGCWRLAQSLVGAMRFEADGDPDPTFGGDGSVATSVPADAVPTAAAVDGAGRTLIALRPPAAASAGQLIRLLPDGTLDPEFGVAGVADFSVSGAVGSHNTQHISVLPDGRLLVAGESNSGPAFLAQFTPDGDPDTSFVAGGVQALPELGVVGGGGTGRELVAAEYDATGRIVGGGTMSNGSGFTLGVVRFVRQGTVAVDPGPSAVPRLTVTPNPGAHRVALHFDLPAAGPVRLAVYDALGREIALVVDAVRPAGPNEAVLDAGRLAPGAYVARLQVGGASRTYRFTITR